MSPSCVQRAPFFFPLSNWCGSEYRKNCFLAREQGWHSDLLNAAAGRNRGERREDKYFSLGCCPGVPLAIQGSCTTEPLSYLSSRPPCLFENRLVLRRACCFLEPRSLHPLFLFTVPPSCFPILFGFCAEASCCGSSCLDSFCIWPSKFNPSESSEDPIGLLALFYLCQALTVPGNWRKAKD